MSKLMFSDEQAYILLDSCRTDCFLCFGNVPVNINRKDRYVLEKNLFC